MWAKIQYYTYVLRDPRPGKNKEPFYVGKGRGRRSDDHWRVALRGSRATNPLMGSTLEELRQAGLEPLIEKHYWADEGDTFAHEIELITRYGQRIHGTGPLCNIKIPSRQVVQTARLKAAIRRKRKLTLSEDEPEERHVSRDEPKERRVSKSAARPRKQTTYRQKRDASLAQAIRNRSAAVERIGKAFRYWDELTAEREQIQRVKLVLKRWAACRDTCLGRIQRLELRQNAVALATTWTYSVDSQIRDDWMARFEATVARRRIGKAAPQTPVENWSDSSYDLHLSAETRERVLSVAEQDEDLLADTSLVENLSHERHGCDPDDPTPLRRHRRGRPRAISWPTV